MKMKLNRGRKNMLLHEAMSVICVATIFIGGAIISGVFLENVKESVPLECTENMGAVQTGEKKEVGDVLHSLE